MRKTLLINRKEKKKKYTPRRLTTNQLYTLKKYRR